MLYVIDGKYYIKIGRKFIRVNVTYKNNDVDLKPMQDAYIEDNGSVKYTTQVINEKFKEKFKYRESQYSREKEMQNKR